MKTLYLYKETNKSDLELLEQVYQKVKVGENVKLNGHSYRRIRPLNTKSAKYLYHFIDIGDIYSGQTLIEDDDGEDVNVLCEYKAILN